MVNLIESEKGSLLRSTPRLLQILRILVRHGFLGALRGKHHWPSPPEVRKTFEELGATLPELFSSFSETPLAAATIAQVHEATLRDGRHVVVKAQRPDLEEIIATDIAAMNGLVTLVENLFPRLRALDLPVLVSEFADSLNRETDFGGKHDPSGCRALRWRIFPNCGSPKLLRSIPPKRFSRWNLPSANG